MKYLKLTLVALFCFLTFSLNVEAKEKATLYFFHGDGCPHCAQEEIFLDEIKDKYKDDLKIKEYEVWYNFSNQRLMEKVASTLNTEASGVPFTVIGKHFFEGYSDANKGEIEDTIKQVIETPEEDVVSQIKDNKEVNITNKKEKSNSDKIINVPIIGKVNVLKVSIPIAAILIGLVDGFNPCAMWVLLFLISTLIGMKDRKKMWILGGTFLLTSALMYLVIMFSIFKITTTISTSILLRNIIALVAILGGGINLYSYLKSRKKDSGCEVVDDKKRKQIFSKIKKFTKEKSLLLALLGVITLAISVNIIELACSAGLPLVFTEILSINKVSTIMSLIYTLIYILFFLLDDLIIFIIAMTTMKLTGISTKYSKYSHLIGGVLLLIIGLLLIIKPEWLMFNFS